MPIIRDPKLRKLLAQVQRESERKSSPPGVSRGGEPRTLTYKEAEREIFRSIDARRHPDEARMYHDPMMMREPRPGVALLVNGRSGDVYLEASSWHEMHAQLAARGHFPPANYVPDE